VPGSESGGGESEEERGGKRGREREDNALSLFLVRGGTARALLELAQEGVHAALLVRALASLGGAALWPLGRGEEAVPSAQTPAQPLRLHSQHPLFKLLQMVETKVGVDNEARLEVSKLGSAAPVEIGVLFA
jgi:hypothetical protein